MYYESQNRVVKHLVNRLRDVNTDSFNFRMALEELTRLMVAEAFAQLPTKPTTIDTWQGPLDVERIDESALVFIPILRAGEPMLAGILKALPNARSGFIAMKRDEATAKAVFYYENIPDLQGKTAILLDPMVATGGSLIDSITFIKSKQPQAIYSINIIGAHTGVELVNQTHPDIHLHIAQIDPKLNAQQFIIPGLGDAGDRAFFTPPNDN
ncbi:uracil phosphoribosyltransferase [Ostreibacterium oceani]|uniref:Uracil phosphoribosyltransferase n=1 Tax=Ostreibacterium oceani TaxID=2654998 RepID=A0A6N7EV11_9GAMM|nr:uracil phosphoribosyltransferase [Ostreibacterium oceani]MPV85445.1 uracil phosphoribosyltransferase [Ostreibacterium oceani]